MIIESNFTGNFFHKDSYYILGHDMCVDKESYIVIKISPQFCTCLILFSQR